MYAVITSPVFGPVQLIASVVAVNQRFRPWNVPDSENIVAEPDL